MKHLILATAIALLATGCGSGYSAEYRDSPVMSRSTSAGAILTTPDGMTLYTFDRDSRDQSVCSGQCAENWPPYMAHQDAQAMGEFSLIPRSEGGMQWTYEGKPLYLFIRDEKPGDVSGDGFRDIWHVVPADEMEQEHSSYGASGGGGGGY